MALLLRYKLHEKYTIEELTEMIKTEINQNKSNEIAQAINLHLIDKKNKTGLMFQQMDIQVVNQTESKN